MDCRVIGERSDAVLRTAMPGNDAIKFRSRDAASRPSFAHNFKKHLPAKGGGAPAGASIRLPRSNEARPRPVFPSSPACGGGLRRGRPPFGAPPRHSPRFLGSARPGPRFLESPDPNGRTLSGTSAASTSQSGHAPDGTMPKPPARQERRTPLAGTAPAPSVGVFRLTSLTLSGICSM